MLVLQPDLLREEYTIDTPENITFGYAVAGIGSRFIGALIDTNSQPIRSPVVVMSITDSDLQLSPFVLAKSNYLINLINTATQANTTQYEQSLKDQVEKHRVEKLMMEEEKR